LEKQNLKLQRLDDYRWLIPKEGKMRAEGLIYAVEEMLTKIREEDSLQQVANVAHLPGIIARSLAMPDIHSGYGFPIGGVAAFDEDEGIISPGGVGYDINCGVRLLSTQLDRKDIQDRIKDLLGALFKNIPSGVGSRRKDLKLTPSDEHKVLKSGAAWAISQGFGIQEDLKHIESHGTIPGAYPEIVSPKALERGRPQLGTLGSGNHFVEIGYVVEIYDDKAAQAMKLFREGITIMIHTGSRGLGYQICDDFIRIMLEASRKYEIELPDRQLCCAPVKSPEGRDYLAAMACAANYAFANRQIITHWVRQSFEEVLRRGPRDLGLDLVYDVCHNIAKLETYTIQGQPRRLTVHRKGATRAFPPGHPEIPEDYQAIGQPVLIPGDMGTCSYVLVGTQKAMEETFGSTCHGAGRVLSRHQAKKVAKGRAIVQELADQGILVRAASKDTVVEEIPEAYKDVSQVVNIAHNAGISRKVAKIFPLAVIKG
jgi:tRNA-splicing ligase RtcB